MLSVWLPLNGDLHNQGLSNITAINNGATVDNNGKIGKCYSFDGNDDFINLGNIGSYFDGSAFSICFWIFSLENKTRAAVFSGYGLSSTSNFFGLELNSSNNNYCNNNLRFGWLGSDTYSPDDFVTYNAWTHICVTYDGVNQIKMYKNGALIQTSTRVLNAIPVGNTYYLGRDSRTGSTAFNGKLNDFRIYDHCLSPRECKQISTALALHYPLAMPGQENLIVNSSGYGGINGWNVSKANSLSVVNDSGNKCLKITSVSGDTNRININQSLNSKIDINNLTTYTISFYYKAESTNNTSGVGAFIRIANSSSLYNDRLGSTSTLTLDNNWHFASITGDLSSFNGTGVTSVTLFLFAYKAAVYYSHIKFELGSIATPWIPNPSDTEYSALGFNDGIEYDVSGYNRNGTKNGTIKTSSDTARYTTSYIFNGSSNYIETDPLPTETKTISIWVKTTWTSSSGYRLAVHDKNTGLAIGWSNTGLITYIGSSNGGLGSFVNPSGIIANQWNHIVVVKTGNTTRDVYINGVKATPVGGNYWGGDLTKLHIGARHYSGNYSAYFNGSLSDFRAYVTALSADDVLELYHAPMSLANNGTLLAQGELQEV